MKVLVIDKANNISQTHYNTLLRSGVSIAASADQFSDLNSYGFIYENNTEMYDEIVELLCARAQNRPALIGSTERLEIREIGIAHAEDFRMIIEECRDELEDTSLSGLSYDKFLERHRAYIKYAYELTGFGLWGLFLKASPQKMIGFAGVNVENHTLSYAITKACRNQGYAYEACCFILGYMAEEYSVTDISAKIKATNYSSIRLAAKLGIATTILN